MSAGYKGILYYGTAGSTAATQVTNCVDLNYDTALTKVSTMTRGDGSGPPTNYEEAVSRNATITWSMLHKTDATLTALLAAARVGDVAVALRTKANSTGTGFDGDCTVSVVHDMTLSGQSIYNFTATPTDRNRAASLNA
jgi:hypothetical protein